MNPVLLVVVVVALFSTGAISIDHDQVEPIAQPEHVTDVEKAAVSLKPALEIKGGCHPFPAVNAAGLTSGGLKGTGGTSGCEEAPLGSQVYGRAARYQDKWAIMYAWYFPKGWFEAFPTRRHDWGNIIVWIDDPSLAAPAILAVSMQASHSKYAKEVAPAEGLFLGTTPKIYRANSFFTGNGRMGLSRDGGDSLDLIMWEQLTEEARVALNSVGQFGSAEVPFADYAFDGRLKDAWPF
ncbi:hypothetical protein PHYBOEH_008142 [Phytophthora boehmeriae]|uniref:Uncharacterized protein n=1 Tax=Phytophthora boehmeriae TaxID=109152 RepID=A0A8T1W7N8_9STRA|nr:hypothetical protein PHYBOEH_008142 [Phytophthora boehmeriae]